MAVRFRFHPRDVDNLTIAEFEAFSVTVDVMHEEAKKAAKT